MLSAIIAIATVCVLIPFLICIPITLVGGSRKTWQYSVGRIACLVLAVIVAMCLVCLTPLGDLASNAAFDLLGEDLEDVTFDSDAVGSVLYAMIRALSAPAVFLLCFEILFLILRLILLAVFNSLNLRKKESQSFTHNAGTWLGLAHGLLLALVLTAPICGYFSTVLDAAVAFRDTDAVHTSILQDKYMDDELDAMIGDLPDTTLMQVLSNTAGRLLFDPVTSIKCETDHDHIRFRLRQDTADLVRAVGDTICFMDRMDSIQDNREIDQVDRERLDRARESLTDSELIRFIAADFLSCAADAWSRDQEFAGVARPETGAIFRPTLDKALEILKQETSDLLADDLKTVTDIAVILVNGGLLDDDMSYNDLMRLLGDTGENEKSLIGSVLSTLRENPHTAPLADEFNALSMRVVAKVLDESGLLDGKYDAALEEVSATLNDVMKMTPEERSGLIKEGVATAMREYDDITIPDDVAVAMCEKVLADLADEGEITGETLKTYLTEHAAELAGDLAEDLPDSLPDDLPDDLPDGLPDGFSDLIP